MRRSPALLVLALAGCRPPAAAPDAPVLEVSDTGLAYTWEGHGSVSLAGAARGEGAMTVAYTVEGDTVVPTVTAGPDGAVFEGLVLAGPWQVSGDAEPVLWRQGYQSWSWSGVTAIAEPSVTDGVPAAGGDGDVETIPTEAAGTSWWAGLVGKEDGDALLVGVTRATTTKFYTAFGADTAWAVWGMRGEQVTLGAGESVRLDPLWIGVAEDAGGLWTDWAAAVPGRPPTRAPWVGWSDWYQYYGQATEADIRANLAAAAALDPGLAPLDLFQVDDGWEKGWGQWEPNDSFPTHATLAADIHAAGFTPGLWMAPFYVSRDTDTYAAHADWWVRDRDGAEIVHGELSGNSYAILDVTQPEAAAWLRGVIRAKVAEGWTYLKLDFLYAGAVEGVRHDDVTGMQAFALGMALLRDAMGEDTWFLACGAPMLPSVGFADSWRSGADIAYAYDPDPRRAYLRWQARSTAARAFANGVWWWNDADNLLARAPATQVDVTGAVAATLASGGVWLLGDAFANLDAARLDTVLAPDVVALRGATAVPRAPLGAVSGLDAGPVMEAGIPDDTVPTIWDLGDNVTVLLNLSDGPVDVAGPGGTELLTGGTAAAGTRTLAAGAGEVWTR